MLTLAFGGDTSLGDVHLRKLNNHLGELLRNRPERFMEGVAPLVSGCDEVVVNLETVLAVQPSSPWEGKKRYLGWDTPAQTVRALGSINASLVSLANNHAMDFGGDVLLETIAQLEAAGIAQVGAGANVFQACAPHVIEVAGSDSRIYLLAGMEVQKQLRDEYGFYARLDRPGVNQASTQRLLGTVLGIRSADPGGLIIVMPHWGGNYKWVSSSMLALEDALYQAGADIIIGHGAHMLQQMRLNPDRATLFSLGNFVFNWAGRFDAFDAPPFGLVARLEIEPCVGGWQGRLKAYPILSDNRKTDYLPRPVDAEEFRVVQAVLRDKALDDSPRGGFLGGSDKLGRFLGVDLQIPRRRK